MKDRRELTAHVIEDIVNERERQVSKEGWTPAHDDDHDTGGLAVAAACYALNTADKCDMRPIDPGARAGGWVPKLWPWASKWWKPKDRRRDLVRAGALIVAEIERLDRAEAVARSVTIRRPKFPRLGEPRR